MKDGWRQHDKRLTDKQKELLPLLAQGKGTREMAAILKIGATTVSQRMMGIIDCLRLVDKNALIAYAKEWARNEEA